jgi:DNA-binding response OmpR family regulator
MTRVPTVLLVAPTDRVAAATSMQLTDSGLDVTVVTSFAEGRERLRSHPDLLISEVRLGAYNGLHLALRAQSDGIPAILVGEGDQVLEREAAKMGAAYILADGDRQRLDDVVDATGIQRTPPAKDGHRTHAA